MNKKTISNTFTVNTIIDGESAPYYFQEWFAWSNDPSTSSVITPPTISGSWATSIPAQGSYAYLWRKSIRYVWNENTRQYSSEAAQYFRMSGTDGTSIHARGQVANASSRGNGTATIITDSGTQTITLSDGDAVTQLDNGHLYQWVTEGGGKWLDLGQFKGESGKTYYTHIAWATNVNYNSSGVVTRVDGFTIDKSPNDTTHLWMGVLVNQDSSTDSSAALDYTWSYTKGVDGFSVQAQYAPNNNPSSSQIHNTWQNGDIYMRTKQSNETNWSSWNKIVGESGGETDYQFAISANKVSQDGTSATAPTDISSSDWQNAPLIVTTAKPYLWSKVQKKDGNGNNVGNPSYMRLTGEESIDYSVEGALNTIKVGTGQTSTLVSCTYTFYQKPAVSSTRSTVSCYYAVYLRSGNTFSLLTMSTGYNNHGSGTSVTVSSNVPYKSGSVVYDAVVIYIFPSSYYRTSPESQNYMAKKEIPIVKDGDTAFVVDLENEMTNVALTEGGNTLTAVDFYFKVRAFYGTSNVLSDNECTVSASCSDSNVTLTTTAAKTTGVRVQVAQNVALANSTNISVTVTHTTYGTRTVIFTLAGVRGGKNAVLQELLPSLDAISFARTAAGGLTPSSRDLTLSIKKTQGGSTSTQSISDSGLTIRWSSTSMPASKTGGNGWGNGTATGISWNSTTMQIANTVAATNIYIAAFNSAGTLVDRETIPVIKDGEHGDAAPYYFQEWFAWSNDPSTSSVITPPTISGSWATSIPAQGSYAYLWRKSIRYVWNESTRQYIGETAQYFRMSGTNGTSIAVKGHVATKANLPTTHNDGDAYVVDADGHLYMWSNEANQWLDLGQFQGQSGKTYYTHIAWATNVTISGGVVTSVDGFTTAKSPNDTTRLWMGVLVNEDSGTDSSDAKKYTWSYTRGTAIVASIDNEMDGVQTDANGKVVSTTIVSTSIRTYSNGKLVTTGITAASATLCGVIATPSISGGVVTYQWTIPTTYTFTNGKAEVTLQVTYNNTTYSNTFTLMASMGSAAYKLVPSVNEVIKKKSGSFSPATFTCYCTSLSNGVTSDNPTEATMQYSYDGSTWTTFYYNTQFQSSTVFTNSRDKLYLRLLVNSTVMDKQTLSLIEDGTNGDDAVTYDIVFSEAWAKVSENGIITARLKGIAYKITGSNPVPQAGVTIRYGYILNDIGTYVNTTALSDGSFDTGSWFNGHRIEGAAKNSQNIFAAIIINNTVMCTKYVTIAKQGDTGARGKIGRFFYFGGTFDSSDSTQTFVVNDAQAPYFEHTVDGQKRYHVFNYEINGSYTMSQMWTISSNWNNKPWEVMTDDFKYIITEALFGAYAHLGSWIFNKDYMLSEKDTNSNPRGQQVYNGMDNDSQLTSGFIPSIAFDASNGRASFSGDKVRFNPSGSGWLANGNISWDANGNASYMGSFDAVSSQNGGWRINRYTDYSSIPTIEGVNVSGDTVFQLMFDSNTSDLIYPHDYGGLYIYSKNPSAAEYELASEYAREAWLISFRTNTNIYMTAWVGNQYPYIHGVALNNKDFYIGVKDYGLWLQASQWPQLSNVANNQVFVDDYGLVRVKGYNDSFIPQGSSQTSGTVTWVNVGTGLTSSTGGAITTSGTISISSTYQTYISNGNTAYGWGNHANAGYAKTSALSSYLPLTGGTITGNLTVNGGLTTDSTLTTRNGNLNVWSPQNYTYLPRCLFIIENVEWARLEMDTSAAFHFKHGSTDNTYSRIYAASFNQASDLRKKTIIGDVPINLYNIANAPLFKFTWKDEKKFSGQHIGSAAQYWQTVLPELVSIGRDADMTLAMQYDVIALASAITVAKTVVSHEERIKILENENKSLKEEIELLKNKS